MTTPTPPKGPRFELRFELTVVYGEAELWPDGDMPASPTTADVRKLVEAEGGPGGVLDSWCILESNKPDVKLEVHIAGSPLKDEPPFEMVGDPESGEHALEPVEEYTTNSPVDQTQRDRLRIQELEVMLTQFKLEALTCRQQQQEHELALARASASAWQAGHEAGVKAGVDWAIKGQELPADPQPDPNGVGLFQNPYVEALYERIDKLCRLYDEAWDAVRAGLLPETQVEYPMASRHWVEVAVEAMSMTGFVLPDVVSTGPACMSNTEVQQVHRAFRAFVGRDRCGRGSHRPSGCHDVEGAIQGRDNVQAFVHDLLQELVTNGVHTEAEVERMAFLHVEVVKMIAQLFWVASSKEGSPIPNYHVTTFVNPMVPEETVEFVMRRLHKEKHISFVRMQRAVDAIRTLPSGRDDG